MADGSSQSQLIQGWIDRLQAGDSAARGELLKVACERLTRLARKMLHSYPRVHRWEETDDVFQNAMMRLHRSLDQVKPQTVKDFFSLAALNIRRELLDLAKHYYGPQGQGAHHITHAAGDTASSLPRGRHDPADESHEPARLALWTEFHQQVESLPEDEREVFDLLWYQGLTQKEVADLLKISERTIKRRWQSARLKLHEALNGELPES
ncbi:MAG: sigma-70 family RNA polymerase sigma factor [Gemmataceae bacterium]|nr:sigma-70 family RNA polymerase sigma factor [Gemmataceae bacterium]